MAGNCISKSKEVVETSANLYHGSYCIRHCSKKTNISKTWISRESPEGGCVIINDTSSQTRLLEEILKQKRTVTAYEGYLVNEEDNLDPIDWDDGKCKSEDNFPIEIVELPSEPDGKHIDIHFVREGQNDHGTQTTASLKPENIDCGVSVRSMNSDRQQWSFSLYNFEDNGRISREDLTNLVRSIYDALGKSVDKANKKSSSDQVKKVKVHISVSKQKHGKEMRGAVIVPRREVAVGAEDTTAETEKQLEQLKLEEVSQEKPRRRKEEKYSTVQVLNNDLGKVRLHSGRCKCCWPEQHNKYDMTKRCSGQYVKNNNLLADNCPSRRQTEPGQCLTETKIALLNQDLVQLVDKKTKSKSQRPTSRRRPTYPGGQHSGHASPVLQAPGRSSPGAHSSGHTSPGPAGRVSPVVGGPVKNVAFDPSYAYHADESKYLYVHAVPRKTPFEEPKSRKKRKSKSKRARDAGQENPQGVPGMVTGAAKSVVHRHEHVHHHYHHYGEKR